MDKLELEVIESIAGNAGEAIMEIYNQAGPVAIDYKADDSPLTAADRAAHDLIVAQLMDYAGQIPILSEESESVSTQERLSWDRYWLVDPLDGTKEFISRNGEFTVNIALIEKGEPVLGVVHVPVTGHTYSGSQGKGASLLQPGSAREAIGVTRLDSSDRALRVVASRRHRGPVLDKLIGTIEREFDATEVVNMGSSLKICLLASGEADIYPRLAPTSEWDTAAAHAILSAAGGAVLDTAFQPLRYNQKHELLNPHFVALADASYPWQLLLSEVLAQS